MEIPMSRRNRIAIIVISAACWLVACCLPALNLLGLANTQGGPSTMVGIVAFIQAFFAILTGQFAWLANPLWFAALVLIRLGRNFDALIASVMAIALAQQTWVVVGTEIYGDEGGVRKYLVTSLGLGFYLWVLSFVIVAGASIAGGLSRKKGANRSDLGETSH